MNFFEKELRKLFEDLHPDATFVGRNCYIPLGDRVRACASFKTSGHADHYDTLHVKVLDRKEGPIDNITIRLSELLGKKQSPSPYLRDGVNPHIWVDGDKAEWYGFKPSAQDYQQMREAVEDYIEVFREPELNESQGMSMQM